MIETRPSPNQGCQSGRSCRRGKSPFPKPTLKHHTTWKPGAPTTLCNQPVLYTRSRVPSEYVSLGCRLLTSCVHTFMGFNPGNSDPSRSSECGHMACGGSRANYSNNSYLKQGLRRSLCSSSVCESGRLATRRHISLSFRASFLGPSKHSLLRWCFAEWYIVLCETEMSHAVATDLYKGSFRALDFVLCTISSSHPHAPR